MEPNLILFLDGNPTPIIQIGKVPSKYGYLIADEPFCSDLYRIGHWRQIHPFIFFAEMLMAPKYGDGIFPLAEIVAGMIECVDLQCAIADAQMLTSSGHREFHKRWRYVSDDT